MMGQDVARRVVKPDLETLGVTTRDCPQINGIKDNVAVAFRQPRTAVADFGQDAAYGQEWTVVFNGAQGVTHHETTAYGRGMAISLPPPSVLVAYGIATSR
jgi:hypothetical protein